MRKVVLLSGLVVLFGGRPASAQNLWPVSFGYWFPCPDPHMPDLLGADQSIDRARMLDRLCVEEIRGVMSLRSQAMGQQELTRYNSANMLPPIYPETTGASHPAGASPGGGSSTPSSGRSEEWLTPESERGQGTTAPAAPPDSRSPFPSGSKPEPSANRETPKALLPSSSPTSAPTPLPSPAAPSGVTSSGVKPSDSLPRSGVPHP